MMMGEAMGGGGPLEPGYHSISGTEREKQLGGRPVLLSHSPHNPPSLSSPATCLTSGTRMRGDVPSRRSICALYSRYAVAR
jgi:hypothetical protein